MSILRPTQNKSEIWSLGRFCMISSILTFFGPKKWFSGPIWTKIQFLGAIYVYFRKIAIFRHVVPKIRDFEAQKGWKNKLFWPPKYAHIWVFSLFLAPHTKICDGRKNPKMAKILLNIPKLSYYMILGHSNHFRRS